MANFQRLILISLFCIPAFLPNTALADYQSPLVFYHPTSGEQYWPSASEACTAYIDKLSAATPSWNIHFKSLTGSGTSYVCTREYTVSGNTYTQGDNITGWYLCPPPATRNANPYTCAGDPPPPPCIAGEVLSSGYYDGGKSPTASFPSSACNGSCLYNFYGDWPATQSKQADGMHYYAHGEYVNSGLNCSSGASAGTPTATTPPSIDEQAAAAKAAAEAAAAAAAKAAAQAAADAKNAAAKDAAAAAAAAAKAADDAAKAAADAAAKAAADNAATQANPNATQAEKDAAAAAAAAAEADKNAKQADAAAKAGAAAASQKDETPPEQKDFCELHPSSSICKQSGINAGFCFEGSNTGFNCDGDAVLCALAANEAEMKCKILEQDAALSDAFLAVKSESPTLSPAHVSQHETVTIASSLNASSSFAASCPADVYFNFGGKAIKMPISTWCPYLEAVGYIFLALSYVVAARMLAGSV